MNLNNQSMGALLILVGFAALWALWSKQSPFQITRKAQDNIGGSASNESGGTTSNQQTP